MGLPSVPNHEPGKRLTLLDIACTLYCCSRLLTFIILFLVEVEDEDEAELRELRESMAM